MQRFAVGDKASHYSEAGNTGTLVRVGRPWWDFFGRGIGDGQSSDSSHTRGLCPASAVVVQADGREVA